jgi:hypothetical protein
LLSKHLKKIGGLRFLGQGMYPIQSGSYLRDVLDQLAAGSADADVSDLLPDAWAIRFARPTDVVPYSVPIMANG